MPFFEALRREFPQAFIKGVFGWRPQLFDECFNEIVRGWSTHDCGDWDIVFSTTRQYPSRPRYTSRTRLVSMANRQWFPYVCELDFWASALTELGIRFESYAQISTTEIQVRNRIGFIASSSAEKKNWPIENWSRLLHRLPDYSFTMFGTTEHDGDVLEAINPLISDLKVERIIDQPLSIVKDQIARCGLFIAGDTGLGHLAAALGVQTITLMIVPMWTFRVRHPDAVLINKAEITVEEVLAVWRTINSGRH